LYRAHHSLGVGGDYSTFFVIDSLERIIPKFDAVHVVAGIGNASLRGHLFELLSICILGHGDGSVAAYGIWQVELPNSENLEQWICASMWFYSTFQHARLVLIEHVELVITKRVRLVTNRSKYGNTE